MKELVKEVFDKFYWKTNDSNFSYETLKSEVIKPFSNLKPDFNDERVNTSYQNDNQHWFHKEIAFRFTKPVIVEPQYGIILNKHGNIFSNSHQFSSLFPSVPRFIKSKLSNNYRILDKAILFDGSLGTNYFHFFSDVLSKLWVIEEYLEIENIPILISEKSYKTRFFQYLIEKTRLKDLQWEVQKATDYYKVNNLYFAKPMPYRKNHWEKIRDTVNVKWNTEDPSKKVFLTRSQQSGRFIENLTELLPLFEKYTIEIVDTNGWGLSKQIELLENVSLLVGIHGAGMTNMMWSTNPKLKVLEINPSNRVSCHYYWLANTLGYKYDVLLGSELPYTNVYPEKGFTLEKQRLEKHLQNLMGY